MEMISLVYEQFNDITASKIIQFMQHPTAKMINDYFEYKDVLKFDTRANLRRVADTLWIGSYWKPQQALFNIWRGT